MAGMEIKRAFVCDLLGSIWVKSVWIKSQRVLEEFVHSPSHIEAELNLEQLI